MVGNKKYIKENTVFFRYFEVSRKVLRWFTPIGEADSVLEEYLNQEDKSSEYYTDYKKSFRNYVYSKRFQIVVKILLSASFISSAAAAFGFGLDFITKLASYIGFSVLVGSYFVSRYFVMRYKEKMYVHREILLTESRS